MSNPELSIVIPVYNERDNLAELNARLHATLDALGRPFEIIMVDDGSRDSSFDVLRELQANDPALRAVRFRRNFGQTAAFAVGFNLARGQIIITMDADLQNDPADIPRLLEKMGAGYDVVSGWRVERKEPFLTRRLPSMVANWLISIVTGVHLHDYGCSLKAYHRDVVKNVQLYGEMHRFIPALASWIGIEVAEVPVADYPRRHGKSKYGLSRTPRVLLDLITVRFLLSYSLRPMRLFGGAGLFTFAAGTIIGLALSSLKLIYGYHYPIADRPLLSLAILLVMLGFQMMMMGLLGEFMVRTYHKSQQVPTYFIREILPAEESDDLDSH